MNVMSRIAGTTMLLALVVVMVSGCPSSRELEGGWYTQVGELSGYTYFYSDGTLSWEQETGKYGNGTWYLDGEDLTLYIGDYTYTGTFTGGNSFTLAGLFEMIDEYGNDLGYTDWDTWEYTRDDKLLPYVDKAVDESRSDNPASMHRGQ